MSAVIEMTCPHCQQVIRTNARYAGMDGPCPHCGKTVRVEAPSNQVFEPVIARGPSSSAPTDANALLAAGIAAGLTFVAYAAFFVVQNTYLGQLFTDRGPIPFIATFVTFWGLAIILLKYVAVKQQMSFAEMEMDFIPLQKGMQIDASNVDSFLQHLDGLPARAHDGILGRRMRGALEHFRSRSSVPEVHSYLNSQAEIDASGVDSGYTLVRAIIWAVPILGFIGTVMGISAAVSGLAGSLDADRTAAVAPVDGAATGEAAGEAGGAGSQMIAAMGKVTQGLATAFDTTFLALVMAILLLFPTESLKRIEYRMLDRIESFTNDALLRRMADAPDQYSLNPDVARLIEPVFRRHQQWLMEWQGKVEKLGTVIGNDFEKYVQRMSQHLKTGVGENVDNARKTLESLDHSVSELTRCTSEYRQLCESATNTLQETLTQSEQTQQRVQDRMERLIELSAKIPDSPNGSAGDLGAEQLATAAAALEQVANRMGSLLSAQSVDGAPANDGQSDGKGGLFSIFKR